MFDLTLGRVAAAVLLATNMFLTTAMPVDEHQMDKRIELPSLKDIQVTYMRTTTPQGPLVFYNVDPAQVPRSRLIEIAQGLGGNAQTLYDVYRTDSDRNAPFNNQTYPFNRILAQGQERDWFRITSRAFAQVGVGRAYLIWDGQREFTNAGRWWEAIWSTDEFDAILRGQTGITAVYVVNPTTGVAETTPRWRRGDPAPPGWHIDAPDVEPGSMKRSTSTTQDYVLPDGVLEAALARRTPLTDGIEQNPEQTVFTPGQSVGWVPGRCSFHFKQRTLNFNLPGIYFFDLEMYDNEQTNVIGGLSKKNIDAFTSFAMPSRLPYTLVISPGEHSTDPVSFAYAGFNFDSSGGVCKTGKYDSGVRQGDCSFACSVFP